MSAIPKRPLGPLSTAVTELGFGGAPLGDAHGAIPDPQAHATLERAWSDGIRFFDTAPWYGHTKSEHRFGQFLRTRVRDDYVLSTKVGRVYSRPSDLDTFADWEYGRRWQGGLEFIFKFDYTAAGVRRSYEDSLQRLGLNRIDCLVIHDLDHTHQKSEDGVRRALEQLETGGGFQELATLRGRGEISAIGAGINPTGMIPRFLERFDIDYFLVAMPYTLLDQSALHSEFPLCEKHGAQVVIGAVFASGILAGGRAQYGYRPASPEVVEKVKTLEELCGRYAISLRAAALQFTLAHPLVAAAIPGAESPEQAAGIGAAYQETVPGEFWEELRRARLVHPDAPLPGD